MPHSQLSPRSARNQSPAPGYSGSQIGDRLYHCVPDAGIVERVAGTLDETNFRPGPHCVERVGGSRRAEQIITALHDQARNSRKLSHLSEKLIRFQKTLVLEIMRFHEWRRGQGARWFCSRQIEPDAG